MVEKSDGQMLTKFFSIGTGLFTDQSPELIFGLGKDTAPVDITIEFLSGEVKSFNDVELNTKVIVS